MHRVSSHPCAALLFAAVVAATGLGATDYEVGPGQAYAAIGDVPWESLGPGDRVLIHWRAAPYQEKWVIARRGTAAQPIVVRGVPGPAGELPVIDGRDAVTRLALDYWNEERGVIKIGGASIPPDTLPAHIVIENLDVRSGRPPYTFTDDAGTVRTYADNAASIYAEKAEHLVIRNTVMRDSGNGLFVGAFDGDTRDVLIEGNWIHDNGIQGSGFQHNSYTAALGIVFQENHYGPLRPGCDGNNLKDRSAGQVVRYNWIEGGNRQLDLVDAEDTPVLVSHPSYRQTFVYGNVLIEPDGAGNSQILHYGGDSGSTADYRKGTLYFHNNTMVSTRSGNTTLMRLSTNDESADARNNLLYVTASGDRLAMLASAGTLDISHNWLKPGWVASHGTLIGTLNDDGTSVEGADPGFVDEGAQDFHLDGGSACIDSATVLHPDSLPAHDVLRQYVSHQAGEERPWDPPLDIGGFEFCAVPPCSRTVFADGFESGDTSAWSAAVP